MGEFWHQFPRAYMGTTLPGFPNLFVMTGPNTGIGHTSAIFIIEFQMAYAASCIQRVLKQGKQSIEVLPEAESNYTTMPTERCRRRCGSQMAATVGTKARAVT